MAYYTSFWHHILATPLRIFPWLFCYTFVACKFKERFSHSQRIYRKGIYWVMWLSFDAGDGSIHWHTEAMTRREHICWGFTKCQNTQGMAEMSQFPICYLLQKVGGFLLTDYNYVYVLQELLCAFCFHGGWLPKLAPLFLSNVSHFMVFYDNKMLLCSIRLWFILFTLITY